MPSNALPSPGQADGHHLIPLRDDNPSSITPAVSWALIATCVLVFLWPLCAVMTWKGLTYVGASVRVLEGSPEGTFMPFWLLKSLLLVFPFVLSLQGLSMLVHALFVMRGLERPAGAAAEDRGPGV